MTTYIEQLHELEKQIRLARIWHTIAETAFDEIEQTKPDRLYITMSYGDYKVMWDNPAFSDPDDQFEYFLLDTRNLTSGDLSFWDQCAEQVQGQDGDWYGLWDRSKPYEYPTAAELRSVELREND